jgi:hypothetical protein
LEALYESLDREQGSEPQTFERLLGQGVITWKTLHFLYQPGSIVITRSRTADYAYHIRAAGYEERMQGLEKTETCQLHGETLDYDGLAYGVQPRELKVDHFKGRRPISSLTALPLSQVHSCDGLVSKLSKRGERAISLNQGGYKSYDGIVRWTTEPAGMLPFEQPKAEDKYLRRRIVLDPEGYFLYRSDLRLKPIPDDLQEEDAKSDEPSTDAQRMLITPFVRGYDLTDKVWAEFEVDTVTEVE